KCHPRILAEEMALGSRRGTALPREILREITTNSRTTAEEKAFEIVADSGLPTPSWNVPVLTAEGEYIGCPDLWFDEVGLAAEFGFFGYRHTRAEDSTTALRRKKRHEVAGIAVLNLPGGPLAPRAAGGAGVPVRRVNRGPRPRCGSNAPREPAKTSSRAPGVRTGQQAPCRASSRAGGAVAGHVLVTAEHIITMSDGEPVVSANQPALAFLGEWITAVGELDQLRERFPDAEVVDFGKATIVPGFNDA